MKPWICLSSCPSLSRVSGPAGTPLGTPYPAARGPKTVIRAQLPARADLPEFVWKKRRGKKKQEIIQLIIAAAFC